MKPNYFLNGRLVILFIFSSFYFGVAYTQVGIGTTNPDTNAKLDITSTTAEPGGLLLPRVALIATNNPLPLTGTITNGMAVYNTATAGSGTTRVTPGFYYHDGGQWVRLASASQASENWALTGNSGTNPGTGANQNYLGTQNNQAFIIATNNFERARFLANGQIAVNRTTTIANTRLTVGETEGNRAIYGNSGWGEGVRGESTSGYGIVGIVTSGTGVFGIASTVNASGGSFQNVHGNGYGLRTVGGGGISYSFPNSGTGAAITGRLYGTTSIATAVNGLGLAGVGDNLLALPARPLGVGVLGYGYETGVFGDSGYFGQKGVHGKAEGTVSSSGIGVFGENVGGLGDGVFGNSSNVGVRGYGANGAILEASVGAGVGAIAWNTAASGAGVGLLALGQGSNPLTFAGTGGLLYGRESGGAGFARNNGATGLIGVGNNITTASLAGNGSGVAGTGNAVGVFGKATTGSSPIGVVGVGNNLVTYMTPASGAGVAGTGINIGVYGHATDASGYGLYSSGNFHATGTITSDQPIVAPRGIITNGFAVADGNIAIDGTFTAQMVSAYGDLTAGGTKNFIIDDPRDPANKYLKHASIESNEILNLYRGVNTFDASGEAVVQLPDYYDAINKNASYQLTPIGAAMPNLYIAEEVNNGSFVIAGGVASKKVSWTLTAERNDPYIRNNPEIRNMVVDKGADRGRYLLPEAYGQSEDKGILNNRMNEMRAVSSTAVARQAIVVQEMQSKTAEAKKLDREEVQNLTSPISERRVGGIGSKKLRDVPLMKAEEAKLPSKTMEQEGQTSSGLQQTNEDQQVPMINSETKID